MEKENKKREYYGYHAIGDIVLNHYPQNIVQLFEDSIKHSNLTIVNKVIHDFGGAVTGVWVLSESHASIHEYPEHNYITVDIYTCGKEGDPLKALEKFKELLDVKKCNIELQERGIFKD